MPVVGADLLGTPKQDAAPSFYSLVAKDLLGRYQLALPGSADDWQIRPDSALHDAACALLRFGKRQLAQLDVPVSEALTSVLKSHRASAERLTARSLRSTTSATLSPRRPTMYWRGPSTPSATAAEWRRTRSSTRRVGCRAIR